MSLFQKFLDSETGNRLLKFAVEHRQRFFITLICAFMVYVFLCLFSYNPTDPAWSHLPNGDSTVTNIGGMGGAWLADVLYLFFGKMAWLVLLWLAMEAYYVLIPERYLFPLRFVSYGLLWVCACIFGVVLAQITHTDPLVMAGVAGQSVFRALSLMLGNIGAYLFAFVCFFGLGYLMVSPLYQGRGYFSDFLTKKSKKTARKPAPATAPTLPIKDSILPSELSEAQSPNHDYEGVLNNFLVNSGIQDELQQLDDEPSAPNPSAYARPAPSEPNPSEPKRRPIINPMAQPVRVSETAFDGVNLANDTPSPAVPTPAPVAPKAIVQEPIIQEPAIQEPAIQEPIVQTPIAPEPIAQKPIIQEAIAPIAEAPVHQAVQPPSEPTPTADDSQTGKLVYEYESAEPAQSYQKLFGTSLPSGIKPSAPVPAVVKDIPTETAKDTVFGGIRLERMIAHSNVPHPPAYVSSLNLGGYQKPNKQETPKEPPVAPPAPMSTPVPVSVPVPSPSVTPAPIAVPAPVPTPVIVPAPMAQPSTELELVRDEPMPVRPPVELSLVQDDEPVPTVPVVEVAEVAPPAQSTPVQLSLEPSEVISANPPNRHDDSFNHQSFAIKTAKHQANLPKLPPLSLLDERPIHGDGYSESELVALSELLEIKLKEFGVSAEVMSISQGPVITSFEVALAAGIKASKVTGIAQDLARSLSVGSVRVVEVIAGKPYIGIEIPNKARQTIRLIELLDTPEFQYAKGHITTAIGKSSTGEIVLTDIYTAPHMLIAGATRSGKSVLVNSILVSMLLKYTPDELRFVMIDPKILELTIYDDIPHLLTPVIIDMNDSITALSWCVNEMNRRYHIMNSIKVKQISTFNEKVKDAIARGEPLIDKTWQPTDSVSDTPPTLKPMPYIVVVVDEYADLVSQVKQIEELIDALARKSRAAGIHIILATQRPSVDVITGVIKANIPARIALSVRQKVDSRTILDTAGAETLLGYGDMLFIGNNSNDPIRVHGAFVTEEEVDKVCSAWRERGVPDYVEMASASRDFSDPTQNEGQDELYGEAVAFVLSSNKTSISSVQRELNIGYNRAAKIIDAMEANGILSAPDHTNKRTILKKG